MEGIPELHTESAVNQAIAGGSRFRIAPIVTKLELTAGLNFNYENVADALKKSSIKHLQLDWSPLILVHRQSPKLGILIEALKFIKELESLLLNVDNKRTMAVLGEFLATTSSLLVLSISTDVHSDCFLDGLSINTSLTELWLQSSESTISNEDEANQLFSRLVTALNENDTISNFTIKCSAYADGKFGDYIAVLPDARITVEQARFLFVKIERNKETTPMQLIKNNNWEELSRYIKTNCTEDLINEIRTTELNLSTKAFVDNLAVRSLENLFADVLQEQQSLDLIVKNTYQSRQDYISKLEKLRKEVSLLESKIELTDAHLTKYTRDLSEKEVVREKLGKNLEAFKLSLKKSEPALKKWQQMLQMDLNRWKREDVTFFLTEIGLEKYTKSFKDNNIDGGALLALDTTDLMATLDMSFRDAKNILMHVYLVQTHHDIYTIPVGVLQWTNETVCMWLEDNKFGHLKDIFKEHQITGPELVFLEKIDIVQHLRIKAIGDVAKLQKEIGRLKDSLQQEKLKNNNNPNNHNVVLERQLEEMKRFNQELKLALEKKQQKKIPEAFVCPITQDIMTDPVVASDGHTYERTAIEQWLKNNNTSPMTGLKLVNKQLTPSHTLKSMIREFVDANKK